MLWAMETTRLSKRNLAVIKRTQRHMMIKMMRRKKKCINNELEPWLEWHIRNNRDAKLLLTNLPQYDVVKRLIAKKNSFAGHIARFGVQNREEHLLKHVIMWRNAFWWHLQKKAIADGSSNFKHAKVGRIARWENQFPKDWILQFSKQPCDQAAATG